jgi:hypothetical protein
MFEKTREGGFVIDVRRNNHKGRVIRKGKSAGKEEGQGDGNGGYTVKKG